MPLSQREIRERATEFAREWATASRENAEKQTFWNEFFNIFDISRKRVASFEEPVKKLGERRGSIDLLWKGTLLVEHKSRGENLDKAFGQALDYFPGLKENELPKYVLVSDFAKFRLYDLEESTQHEFTLAELPNKTHLFGFISGYMPRTYKDQDPVNIIVAEKMGELHDALLASGYAGHELEIFLVRLVYCLFADDTGIFPKDHFLYLIETRTREDGSDTGDLIAKIFQTLNRPTDKRQTTLDEEMQQLPYVNGSLFDESLQIPSFNKKMRAVLLEACAFDWSKVSPAIFGSMFQSVMDREKRRNLGAHYTSEKNILKLVRGLFLDELQREFEQAKTSANRLRALHERLAHLRFFDPACGCGNFLIITYREIRLLEIEILKQLRKLEDRAQLVTDVLMLSRIDVDAMYGIEFEEFPARIAEVALWLTDHQLNMQLSAEFGQTYTRLPLKKSANITHANALRLDWREILGMRNERENLQSANGIENPQSAIRNPQFYVLGNPPFVGKHNRTPAQNRDMEIACRELGNFGVLDYVCAWYVKAAQLMHETNIKTAFVSTNSITQGEQVGALWQYLLQKNVKIHFAHRTFKWSNEARGNAQVYCVIIGFACFATNDKRLFDYENPTSEPAELNARNINPYLVDADDIVVTSRNTPLGNVPEMVKGSQPTDDGNLLLTDEEKDELLKDDPKAKEFVHPLISAYEFLNGENRWCLWLRNVTPAQLRAMPEVMKRAENVRQFRLRSRKAATVRLADVPYLFAEIRQPNSDYVLIPRHSSEHRKYVPMAFFTKDYIASDSCNFVPNATLYHFGVLTSAMHMAWMRQVCGRLEGRYRYSNNIVYNNFPFPDAATTKQRERIERAAQKVLDARAKFPDSTLADLYDPHAMPKQLLDAHRALDAEVDKCYRREAFKSDLERLEYLFALYRNYTDPLNQIAERATKQAAKRRRVRRTA